MAPCAPEDDASPDTGAPAVSADAVRRSGAEVREACMEVSWVIAVRFVNDNDSQLQVKRRVCFFLFLRLTCIRRKAGALCAAGAG